LGSIETHKANGMSDPISHYRKEVDKLNRKRGDAGARKISGISPLLHLGYFPLRSIADKLKIKKYVDYFKLTTDFRFDLYDLLSSLVYARCVHPCSKYRTFHEVLPNLYDSHDYSYDQLLDGLSFLGENYLKFVEIFTACTGETYGINTEKTYFDCTNFYFEIDREDDFRKKGPSKENRRDPIVGLGLLLDSDRIPIGMEMYPGNESEKPVLGEVADNLKNRNNITGRTVYVADKGLNCAKNIADSKKNGDGYLFSKAVKNLPATEKAWVLFKNGYTSVKDRNKKELYRYKSCTDKFPYTVEHEGKEVVVKLTEKRLVTYNPDLAAKKRYEINKTVEKAKSLTLSRAKKADYGEAGKYVNFTDGKGGKARVSINRKAIDNDLSLAGYNLIVTSETSMKDEDIYATYHNLWRIEESFRIMKSDLDTRPVFVQKESTIKGHFLICYLAVLLERIFQFKVLENQYGAAEIFRFIKGFKVVKVENKYVNTTIDSEFIARLSDKTGLPLRNYHLSETQIKSILNCKL
jgi:transposase